jgi:hypothetical protein
VVGFEVGAREGKQVGAVGCKVNKAVGNKDGAIDGREGVLVGVIVGESVKRDPRITNGNSTDRETLFRSIT